MSKFKLEFKLKQHTPLIHFQHDQTGATLRATELKPKLDKFLISHAFNNDFNRYKHFLVGYDGKQKEPTKKDALDYKAKINDINNFEYYLPMPFISNRNKGPLIKYIKEKTGLDIFLIERSPYFANSDKISFRKINQNTIVDKSKTKIEELRFAKFTDSEICVHIYSFNEELLKEIERNIVLFFLNNNFGTRQNKGFGSFSVVSINNKKVKETDSQLKKVFTHKSNAAFNDFNNLFGFILDEYQLLKSGKNYPQYKKSELFKYFIDKNIRWEKRYFKQFINSHKILGQDLFYRNYSAPIDVDTTTSTDYNDWNDRQLNDYKYIRALLGLAEQYEFMVFKKTKDRNGKLVNDVRSDLKKKYLISVEHNPKTQPDKIERLKSPIFFKVINKIVYLGFDDSYKNILGEEFTFTLKLKGDDYGTVKPAGKLQVPETFDIVDFIDKHLSSNWKKI